MTTISYHFFSFNFQEINTRTHTYTHTPCARVATVMIIIIIDESVFPGNVNLNYILRDRNSRAINGVFTYFCLFGRWKALKRNTMQQWSQTTGNYFSIKSKFEVEKKNTKLTWCCIESIVLRSPDSGIISNAFYWFLVAVVDFDVDFFLSLELCLLFFCTCFARAPLWSNILFCGWVDKMIHSVYLCWCCCSEWEKKKIDKK